MKSLNARVIVKSLICEARVMPMGQILLLMILCLGVFECVVGLGQFICPNETLPKMYHISGAFYNPGPYCAFLGTVLPLAVYCIMGRDNRILFYLALFYVVLSIVIMPVLMGRTGWLGALAGCGVVVARLKIVKISRLRIVWGVAIVLLLLVLLYFLKPMSANGRLFIWIVDFMAFSKKCVDWCGVE